MAIHVAMAIPVAMAIHQAIHDYKPHNIFENSVYKIKSKWYKSGPQLIPTVFIAVNIKLC